MNNLYRLKRTKRKILNDYSGTILSRLIVQEMQAVRGPAVGSDCFSKVNFYHTQGNHFKNKILNISKRLVVWFIKIFNRLKNDEQVTK